MQTYKISMENPISSHIAELDIKNVIMMAAIGPQSLLRCYKSEK